MPGPGNYTLNPLIGKEGKKNSMHQAISYSPEKKEQSYKPGPGNYDPDILKTRKKEPAYKQGSSTRYDLSFVKRQTF